MLFTQAHCRLGDSSLPSYKDIHEYTITYTYFVVMYCFHELKFWPMLLYIRYDDHCGKSHQIVTGFVTNRPLGRKLTKRMGWMLELYWNKTSTNYWNCLRYIEWSGIVSNCYYFSLRKSDVKLASSSLLSNLWFSSKIVRLHTCKLQWN